MTQRLSLWQAHFWSTFLNLCTLPTLLAQQTQGTVVKDQTRRLSVITPVFIIVQLLFESQKETTGLLGKRKVIVYIN